jgi:hypothetical protein
LCKEGVCGNAVRRFKEGVCGEVIHDACLLVTCLWSPEEKDSLFKNCAIVVRVMQP